MLAASCTVTSVTTDQFAKEYVRWTAFCSRSCGQFSLWLLTRQIRSECAQRVLVSCKRRCGCEFAIYENRLAYGQFQSSCHHCTLVPNIIYVSRECVCVGSLYERTSTTSTDQSWPIHFEVNVVGLALRKRVMRVYNNLLRARTHKSVPACVIHCCFSFSVWIETSARTDERVPAVDSGQTTRKFHFTIDHMPDKWIPFQMVFPLSTWRFAILNDAHIDILLLSLVHLSPIFIAFGIAFNSTAWYDSFRFSPSSSPPPPPPSPSSFWSCLINSFDFFSSISFFCSSSLRW